MIAPRRTWPPLLYGAFVLAPEARLATVPRNSSFREGLGRHFIQLGLQRGNLRLQRAYLGVDCDIPGACAGGK